MEPELSGGTGGAHAVFVDDRGWRVRWLKWAGRAVAASAGVWLGLLVASLVGASWVPHLSLPAVGPSLGARTPTGGAGVKLPPSAPVIPAPNLTAVVPAPTRAGVSVTTTAPSTGTVVAPAAPAATTPVSTAPGSSGSTPAASRKGAATTTPPGHSGTAPGRTKHHG